MARIAVGGMQHETNTFAPTKADFAAFNGASTMPVQRGAQLLETLKGMNIGLRGASDALRTAGHELVPLVWAVALPSAHVTTDAFERIVGDLIERLRKAGPVDGVFLELHGAMVTEMHDDGEGEILRRVREVVGPDVPIVASLDFHANVSPGMVRLSDGLSVYRTYPHVDMAATGARAAQMLMQMLTSGRKLHKAYRQFDFLTALPSQCTVIEPGRRLFTLLESLEQSTGVALSFAPGFSMADIEDCGMSVMGYGPDAASVEAAVDELAAAVRAAEPDFALELYEPDDAVRRAMAVGAPGAPVVLADAQDNPGAGGNSDTTGILAAMLRHQAQDAVLGVLIDPASARRAHEAGVGATLEFALGAVSGLDGHEPVRGTFTVERLSDGQVTCSGPMYAGMQVTLGPTALLRQGGVRVVLGSRKIQVSDQEYFRHIGIEPASQRLVVVKSAVHFRAHFQPIAREVLVVKAPGPALVDPADFAWTRLREGLRIRPLGRPFHRS